MLRKLYNIGTGRTGRWNKLRGQSIIVRIQRYIYRFERREKWPTYFPILWGAVKMMEIVLSPHDNRRVLKSVDVMDISQDQMDYLYKIFLEHLLIIYYEENGYDHNIDRIYLRNSDTSYCTIKDMPIYKDLKGKELDLKEHAKLLCERIDKVLKLPFSVTLESYSLYPIVLKGSYAHILILQRNGTVINVIDDVYE